MGEIAKRYRITTGRVIEHARYYCIKPDAQRWVDGHIRGFYSISKFKKLKELKK
jgi:hypothetical protein